MSDTPRTEAVIDFFPSPRSVFDAPSNLSKMIAHAAELERECNLLHRELEHVEKDFGTKLLASQARELGLREAHNEFREHVLNHRGLLEEGTLNNEQTNAVLHSLDLLFDKALSAPPPDVVMRDQYNLVAEANAQLHLELLDANAAIAMMNERLEERTQGLLDTAANARLARSAPSFRAGWEAAIKAAASPRCDCCGASANGWDGLVFCQNSNCHELNLGIAFSFSEQALREHMDEEEEPSTPAETFEAHGKTWTRHTPGDPMPCEETRFVEVLLRSQEVGTSCRAGIYHWHKIPSMKHIEIIGWRNADK